MMSSYLGENQTKPPLLARIPIVIFVVLCIFASILGAIIFSVVGLFTFGLVDAVLGRDTDTIYAGMAFGSIFGFSLPIILLVSSRKRKQPPPIPRAVKPANTASTSERAEIPGEEFGDGPPSFASDDQRPPPDVENIWYYTDRGAKHGPVSSTTIEGLFARKQIDKDIFVWRKGMKDWTPIHATEFAEKIDDVAPPLPSHVVNNIIVWLLAFCPLIFAAIDDTIRRQQISQAVNGDVSALTSILSGHQDGLSWAIPAASYFVLCLIDINLLYRAGYRAWYLGASALLFVPVYPFVRANLLKQPPYYGFVFIVLLLLEAFAPIFGL